MKDETFNTSEGLNQVLEIINAKGDTGELKNIVEQTEGTLSDEKKNEEKRVRPPHYF